MGIDDVFLFIHTETGHVYCWGAGKRGQCGVLVDDKCPSKLTSPSKGKYLLNYHVEKT